MSVLQEQVRSGAEVPPPPGRRKSARGALGSVMFASRWLQAPLYLGLIVAQMLYVVTFMRELWHLGTHIMVLTEAEMMLMVLGLVDVVMVANLIIMVTIGGYETFVSRLSVDGHPDQPEWLSQVNANILKVKLAMAIIGISSVHLLKSFVEARTYFEDPVMGGHAGDVLMWQTLIHIAFILSAMALAWIDKLSIASHAAAASRREDGQHASAEN